MSESISGSGARPRSVMAAWIIALAPKLMAGCMMRASTGARPTGPALVRRRDQVRRGIDHRPVEIENYRCVFHRRSAFLKSAHPI